MSEELRASRIYRFFTHGHLQQCAEKAATGYEASSLHTVTFVAYNLHFVPAPRNAASQYDYLVSKSLLKGLPLFH